MQFGSYPRFFSRRFYLDVDSVVWVLLHVSWGSFNKLVEIVLLMVGLCKMGAKRADTHKL